MMPLISMAQFAERPATHVVSLGWDCETAYNLRRFFNFSAAFPFDWWRTSLDGVIRLLRNFDVDAMYEAANLEPSGPGMEIIQSKPSGAWLVHEFPRAPSNRVLPDFRERAAQPKNRTTYLRDKLFGLNAPENRVMFVRLCRPQEASSVPDLGAALGAAFPRPDSTVLLPGFEPPALPWFSTAPLRRTPPGGDWRGDPESWDAALRSTGVVLDNPLLGTFKPSDPNVESMELHRH